jgi:hypothetical protein
MRQEPNQACEHQEADYVSMHRDGSGSRRSWRFVVRLDGGVREPGMRCRYSLSRLAMAYGEPQALDADAGGGSPT